MIRYAASVSDLDLAWKTKAGAALLESALASDDEPETVTAEPGVEACVLAGEEEIVESVASGLLCVELPLTPPRRPRVYARAKSDRKWTRLHRPEDVPYAPGEVEDRGSPRIDPEFVELAAPMDDATRAALRASLVAEGCRDALVVWGEKDTLLDGHNRLAICRELGIPFRVTKLSFPDRAAALAWFVAAQRTRRSLTPHWAMYYLGREYNTSKQVGFKVRSGQSDPIRESARIGAAAGIGEKTVRRAAAFAEAIDRLEQAVPHARRAVLNREIRLSRRQIAQAIQDGVRSLVDLREQAEPEKRDYFAEMLRAARKFRDALAAWSLSGATTEDLKRLLRENAEVRDLLREMSTLFPEFRAELGLVEDGAEAPAEAALSHG
ncbi:MAG: hypothetical protein HMLKMBBP_03857 [Planctomycetes bacterium]|nr:hypothetical protein [Planctomycetota bacterium]